MNTPYDLSTPQGRLRAAEVLGPDGYNKAMDEHRERAVVASVNGRKIRLVHSERFGTLYSVEGMNLAFKTIERASACAADQPTKA